MPTFKRRIANALERLTGAQIVQPAELGNAYGMELTRRVISAFEIDCVFDVGANAGQYALMLRDQIGYGGPIVSFEPVPRLARSLRAASASCSNWHIREIALDRMAGSARFTVTHDAQFSSLRSVSKLGQSLFPEHAATTEQIDVETSTLALEFRHWREALGFRRPFLKIDTQGNDLAVAASAGSMLQEFVAIQAELAIHKLYDGSSDLTDAISFFHDEGFEPCAFAPNNEGAFPLLLETDCIFINRSYIRGFGRVEAIQDMEDASRSSMG